MLTNRSYVLKKFCANPEIFDAHCHFAWSRDVDALTSEVSDNTFSAFINTVTPQEYVCAKSNIKETQHLKIGLGLHPWYVRESDIEAFFDNLSKTSFIGEVGLDFSKKFSQTEKQTQIKVFEEICKKIACSQTKSKVNERKIISIHTCKTQGMCHEILKTQGVLDTSVVIYHWFGDDIKTLKLAISDGCLFSVNIRMLNTKKGLDFAKIIPKEQLLLESDMPSKRGDVWTFDDERQSIIQTWQKLIKMENATLK